MLPLVEILAYGLKDALNPCNLSTMVMFVALLDWLRRRQLPYVSWGWLFIIFSYTASLFFSTGGLMSILYSILFFKTVRIIYAVIGVTFIIVGVIHLMDWIRIKRGYVSKTPAAISDDGKEKFLFKIFVKIGVIALAVYLAASGGVAASSEFSANRVMVTFTKLIGLQGNRDAPLQACHAVR